jgi:hypothetical protein
VLGMSKALGSIPITERKRKENTFLQTRRR